MFNSQPERRQALGDRIETQVGKVLDQFDCIEDTLVDVTENMQSLRIDVTRLESLRSKLQATAK